MAVKRFTEVGKVSIVRATKGGPSAAAAVMTMEF
jgi:hypothetical protein